MFIGNVCCLRYNILRPDRREKMKKITISILALIVGVNAANAVTATGQATVVIQSAITATPVQTMNFGTIVPSTTAATVTMSAAGVRSAPAGVSTYGTSQAGTFTITAAPSTPLTFTFTNGTLTSGANNMTLQNFTHTTSTGTDTTPATGPMTLNVGGDLLVGANQATGTYNGTYQVTVGY